MDDDGDWEVLSRKIESCVRLDAEYFEYPPPSEEPSSLSAPAMEVKDETGAKLFLGGMRFEMMRSGRQTVRWLLEMACGVAIPESRILIHRKSKHGKSAAPTGCASIFVANEADVAQLLSMNQRIFCAEQGIHVASSAEKMQQLIRSRSMIRSVDGKPRGPTHPMIIELANPASSASTPTGSFCTAPPGSFGDCPSSFCGVSSAGFSEPQHSDHPLVSYHRFDGDQATQLDQSPALLEKPISMFVGGLCYEATRIFVAWMFHLIGVKLHPANVMLYTDPQTGVQRGCAQVQIEECDFNRASSMTKCLLCDPSGVFIGDNPQSIRSLQASRDPAIRGPTHAVVIERRKKVTPPQLLPQSCGLVGGALYIPAPQFLQPSFNVMGGPRPPPYFPCLPPQITAPTPPPPPYECAQKSPQQVIPQPSFRKQLK